ncbi:MAG: substrate-binding domain-containing protein [Syntrophomonadaceae bacterium]|jgi:putative molybdopterin biosynthesis protein
MSGDHLLTPAEVATILKIKKNTVYEMIKRGDLPAFRVGRKLRVHRDALASLQQNVIPTGAVAAESQGKLSSAPYALSPNIIEKTSLVICGQDIALDLLTRHLEREVNGLQVLRNHIGSIPGLIALYEGKAHLAAVHLWDSDSDSYNIPYVRRLLPGIPTAIIHIACRQQGFYVQAGNPLNIQTWHDLVRTDINLINREPGCGTRVLLDEKIRALGIDRTRINGYHTWVFSHLEVASRVARGMATVGLGNQKAALQVRGVEFVPIQEERYELVIREEDLSDSIIQSVLSILRSESFKQELQGLGDYKTDEMGTIIAHI